LELEEERQRRETAHLATRFGTELLGESASEEEMLAYAALLSEETLAKDFERRVVADTENAVISPKKIDGFNPGITSASQSTSTGSDATPDSYDADLEEAIRQSLAASEDGLVASSDEFEGLHNIPFRQAKPKRRASLNKSPSTRPTAEGSKTSEANDLDFAIQLSLAEEQSRKDANIAEDEFPILSPSETQIWRGDDDNGKGKRRAM